MTRIVASMTLVLLIGSVALGHALYIVPATDDGVVVVFGHELKPDPKTKAVTWQKLAGLKLTARDAAGKASRVEWTKGEDSLVAKVPAGTQVVMGDVDYGVYAKAGAPARRIRFVPKAVLGNGDGASVGVSCPLEIVPSVEAGRVRFRVLAQGQPVAKAEVEVMVPEKPEHVDVTTDEQGYTAAFEAKGQFGVTVRREEPKSGEVAGQAYTAELTVATLAVTIR